MPKRQDIQSILIIGAGPIIIGQACEFDYAGTQACKALKECGYRVILINSNPATIMTDASVADATYIEPIHWRVIEEIIKKEKPDAILPTMGGQTALNCLLELEQYGILEKHAITLLGISIDGLQNAENRFKFSQLAIDLGLKVSRPFAIKSIKDARSVSQKISYPALIRSSFALGGAGSNIVNTPDTLIEFCSEELISNPATSLLAEESISGWKEFELEVMRDINNHCIVVCAVENIDPIGVHTGDSITVAPTQTLTDKEYQEMRNIAFSLIQKLEVVGGCNVQFALNPVNGTLFVVEVNPRVSRSSALASKATGFPIAKVAAKLAIGLTLNEITNEVTGKNIPAFFEPSLDYVVVKIPRFDFEKFPSANKILMTQMKSVGEVMAIGGTFQEALQKAMCSLDIGTYGFDLLPSTSSRTILDDLKIPTAERLWQIGNALRSKLSIESIYQATKIDPWFLFQIYDLIKEENLLTTTIKTLAGLDKTTLSRLKRKGFSDRRIADILSTTEDSIRQHREALKIFPAYKSVDTCAAEFPAETSYFYSTYENESESLINRNKKVIVLGSGPNRIGQSIEFDYCCVHAAAALKNAQYEAILINCNPETVSTDYDVANKLYFEPLTLEHVLEVIRLENPEGVLTQFGGQTPLKLSKNLEQCNIHLFGASSTAIDTAEDRHKFYQFLRQINVNSPPYFTSEEFTLNPNIIDGYNFPLIVRPSFVIGGRAVQIIFTKHELLTHLEKTKLELKNSVLLIESFLENAKEVEVDLIFDGTTAFISSVIEQLEPTGVHSGDSTCITPPYSISDNIKEQIKDLSIKIAAHLNIIGPINIQFAIKNNSVFAFEVNPRASRTVPFLSKAIGIPFIKLAIHVVLGGKLSPSMMELSNHLMYCIKRPIFSFQKLNIHHPIIDVQMRSTGEIMGVGTNVSQAFSKALLASNIHVPKKSLGIVIACPEYLEEAITLVQALISSHYRIMVNERLGLKINPSESITVCRFPLEEKMAWKEVAYGMDVKFIINLCKIDLKSQENNVFFEVATKKRIFYTHRIREAKLFAEALSISPFKPVFCLQDLAKE